MPAPKPTGLPVPPVAPRLPPRPKIAPFPVAGDDDEEDNKPPKVYTEEELGQVGMRTTGKFKCPECNQRFDSEREVNLHLKYIHRSKEEL